MVNCGGGIDAIEYVSGMSDYVMFYLSGEETAHHASHNEISRRLVTQEWLYAGAPLLYHRVE